MIGKGDVFSINEGNEILFKCYDGTIVKIKALKYEITSIGGGAKGLSGSEAMGLKMGYLLQNKDISILDKKLIDKMRIYLSKNYIECELSKRRAQKIQNAIKNSKMGQFSGVENSFKNP